MIPAIQSFDSKTRAVSRANAMRESAREFRLRWRIPRKGAMAELDAFDLSSRVMTREAYVPHEAANLFDDCPLGLPLDRWPSGTPVKIAGWSRDGVEVRWKETYATIVKEFVDVVPTALAKAGSPDTTRLVVQANW